jgi:hypothetical protein
LCVTLLCATARCEHIRWQARQIKTTQDIATLIRDLQELWLFGGLDTLQNPADEEAHRKKAEEVAGVIEVLAQQKPVVKEEDKEVGGDATWSRGRVGNISTLRKDAMRLLVLASMYDRPRYLKRWIIVSRTIPIL